MLEIPLRPVPSQSTKVVLAGQNCQISIRQTTRGLFADVLVGGAPAALTVPALDGIPLVPNDYASFSGNLIFVDTMGADRPEYAGLGARFRLVYLTAAEYDLIR